MRHREKQRSRRKARPRRRSETHTVSLDGTTVSPKDNPYLGTGDVYRRMQWDEEHDFADYS